MSIKSVKCPRCSAVSNVPATMASIKCHSCGNVFSPSAAAAPQANAPQSSRPPSRDRDDADSDAEDRFGQWFVVGAVAAVAFVGLAFLTFFRPGPSEEPEKPEIPMREQATVVENLNLDPEGGEIEYRVVDLPESTRQKIFRDYSLMIGSSLGSNKKVPKSGAAGQALNKTLGSIVDREVTHFALQNNITEEDVAQIYAEGKAKGW